MKNFIKREKSFGNKETPQYSKEAMCLAHGDKNHAQCSSRGIGGWRQRGRRNFRGRGIEHDASTCKFPWDIIEQESNQAQGKTNDKGKG